MGETRKGQGDMDQEKRKARNQLFEVWKRREAELGRRITYKEASEGTGISAATLSRWSTGQAERFDAITIQALCEFFECEVGDLIVLDDSAP